jgi:hypothetical protein
MPSRASRAAVHHALVVFRQGKTIANDSARSPLEANRRITAQQLEELKNWIRESGLQDDLGAFGEPSSLGTTDVRGSSNLLRALRKHPLVESLVID